MGVRHEKWRVQHLVGRFCYKIFNTTFQYNAYYKHFMGTKVKSKLTGDRASTWLTKASVPVCCRNVSYLSKAVSRCNSVCSIADTWCRTAGSTDTHWCVISRTSVITRSSRKSYGNLSVHSANSCTSRGTNRDNWSWKTDTHAHRQNCVNINLLYTYIITQSSIIR